jgi:proline iminopeptidase
MMATAAIPPTGLVSPARAMYPPIEPHETGFLDVSGGHRIYYEVCGKPDGKPAVFLHGGPGSGCTPSMRQFFDASVYRIVLLDQRGCGRSTPFACLENNTVWDLVSDIETVREHLKIEQWQTVFGGSWGSTLALAYAETHPSRCKSLVLRGIFTLRKNELDWFYQEGASFLFPDAWEAYLAPIPEEERGDLISAYHKRLLSEDDATKMAACKAWSVWEGTTSKLFPDPDFISKYEGDHFALSFARIENHYFYNWKKWVQPEDKLIQDVGKIRNIPAVIVQGRYDLVCPMRTAWDLHRAWPEADFRLVPDAGHSAYEPGIQKELLDACDRFKDI